MELSSFLINVLGLCKGKFCRKLFKTSHVAVALVSILFLSLDFFPEALQSTRTLMWLSRSRCSILKESIIEARIRREESDLSGLSLPRGRERLTIRLIYVLMFGSKKIRKSLWQEWALLLALATRFRSSPANVFVFSKQSEP